MTFHFLLMTVTEQDLELEFRKLFKNDIVSDLRHLKLFFMFKLNVMINELEQNHIDRFRKEVQETPFVFTTMIEHDFFDKIQIYNSREKILIAPPQ